MRNALLFLLGFLAISALGGAWALITVPDGSMLGSSPELLVHTPFRDYFWPGVILGGLFGLGSILVLVLVITRWRWALRAAQVIGVGQLIWILFQLVTIPSLSWLQALYFSTGLGIFYTAHRCRRTIIS